MQVTRRAVKSTLPGSQAREFWHRIAAVEARTRWKARRNAGTSTGGYGAEVWQILVLRSISLTVRSSADHSGCIARQKATCLFAILRGQDADIQQCLNRSSIRGRRRGAEVGCGRPVLNTKLDWMIGKWNSALALATRGLIETVNLALKRDIAKPVSGPLAKLREIRATVSTRTRSSAIEYSRTGRFLWWQCGVVGLLRREATATWRGLHERRRTGTRETRGTQRRHGCHHTHSLVSVNVLGKRGDDSLKADAWIRDKPFFATITGPDITVRLP
jgi:hypothetical protein